MLVSICILASPLLASSARSLQAVVLAEQLHQPIVRQSDHAPVVDARHGLGGHQRVDDRLLRRLHRGLEERRDPLVRQHLHARHALRAAGAAIRRGERDEDVARRIARDAAGARDAHARAARDALELMRQQRRIHRDRPR